METIAYAATHPAQWFNAPSLEAQPAPPETERAQELSANQCEARLGYWSHTPDDGVGLTVLVPILSGRLASQPSLCTAETLGAHLVQNWLVPAVKELRQSGEKASMMRPATSRAIRILDLHAPELVEPVWDLLATGATPEGIDLLASVLEQCKFCSRGGLAALGRLIPPGFPCDTIQQLHLLLHITRHHPCLLPHLDSAVDLHACFLRAIQAKLAADSLEQYVISVLVLDHHASFDQVWRSTLELMDMNSLERIVAHVKPSLCNRTHLSRLRCPELDAKILDCVQAGTHMDLVTDSLTGYSHDGDTVPGLTTSAAQLDRVLGAIISKLKKNNLAMLGPLNSWLQHCPPNQSANQTIFQLVLTLIEALSLPDQPPHPHPSLALELVCSNFIFISSQCHGVAEFVDRILFDGHGSSDAKPCLKNSHNLVPESARAIISSVCSMAPEGLAAARALVLSKAQAWSRAEIGAAPQDQCRLLVPALDALAAADPTSLELAGLPGSLGYLLALSGSQEPLLASLLASCARQVSEAGQLQPALATLIDRVLVHCHDKDWISCLSVSLQAFIKSQPSHEARAQFGNTLLLEHCNNLGGCASYPPEVLLPIMQAASCITIPPVTSLQFLQDKFSHDSGSPKILEAIVMGAKAALKPQPHPNPESQELSLIHI
eukprot:TRINITY_DN27351_c0_g1_i2.p1 TRINITY_DN27351_c0_g1~~TRINITY_DN27351_c0_g1_i2.p1  ORF type:complete len:662 (-),score=91.55 TRINITY_DN27351_c0_g1_i2:25-2010(-)